MKTNFKTYKPHIIGATIGFIIGTILLINYFVCQNQSSPNSSEFAGFECLIPMIPSLAVSSSILNILKATGSTANIIFYILHLILYTFIGFFIGWIVSRFKNRQKTTNH